jgi:hypothetical protein
VGTVLAEIEPHIVSEMSGERQVTQRYRVMWDAEDHLPASTGVYLENELKVLPIDSRFS